MAIPLWRTGNRKRYVDFPNSHDIFEPRRPVNKCDKTQNKLQLCKQLFAGWMYDNDNYYTDVDK